MFTNIISKSTSDRAYNEDGYGSRDDLIFVIDGATGLGENDYMKCGDDAKWFVNNICLSLQLDLMEQTVEEALATICSELHEEYSRRARNFSTHTAPSACIALFRETNDNIEYFGLGDSVGIVEFNDGSYEILYDQNLVNLDNIAIQEMVKISKDKNMSPIEARKFIQSTLIKHRSLMNTEEGYYSLELTAQGIPYAKKRSWKKDTVKRICCMSDGLYEAMEFKLYKDIPALLDAIEKDVDDVFEKLYDAQEEDSLGNKVPRFKLRDDATVVYAKRKED